MSQKEDTLWVCRECAKIYRIPLDTSNRTAAIKPHKAKTRLGRLIVHTQGCPLCGQVRPCYKAAIIKEKLEVIRL